MATKEDQETLRLLVQHVLRAFYEPKYIVIMDQLARHPVLKDDDLAGRIGLQAKELNKLMAILTNDRLVKVHRQNELKEGAQRSIGKQYYYIEYRHFCDVVKWRVSEMRRIIDSGLRNELDNKGYICPNCRATFTPLEADRLMDFSRGVFICDQCATSPGGPHEVVTNDDTESVRGSKDRMERFNKQTRFIREGLKKSEAMVLPAFDVSVWIKSHATDLDKQKQSQNGGLKIAGSGERKEDEGIGVLMSVDKDEATRKREREAEAEAKRQQNVMPSWHLKSTISGDLTSLGVAATARHEEGLNGADSNAAILNRLTASSRSNADILNGLGKIRAPVKLQQNEISIVKDVKPVLDHSADYYDQYYASLEAASRPQSTSHNTPALDFLDTDFEEEERKPSLQYLDTLNEAGKRSRSREDSGVRENKALRSNLGTPVFSRSDSGSLGGPSPTPDTNGNAKEFDGSVELGVKVEEARDDPIVYVGGEPMRFSEVTQELVDEKMSPEEYTAWFEVMVAQTS